ncbi:XisI protein [Spirulina sp. 06S082]|uniref:XisI protein n=1 Tax=Spirulina sp. 06S082 TaxID=3110248 RepID=UPI002B20F44B|nr:XisI protein [Spirulina sp. 06S082]MEA5468478.1 XisI protein [Spirulina sp. 06S082]
MAIDYGELIEKTIQEKAKLYDSVPIETICDREKNHYLLVQVGWVNNHWVYGCLFHLDIIGGKVYIQQNNTEISIANDLVKLGVPKTDIVLGFQSPFKRKFTEYAAS